MTQPNSEATLPVARPRRRGRRMWGATFVVLAIAAYAGYRVPARALPSAANSSLTSASAHTAALAADANRKVYRLLVKEGDFVEKGQPLAEFDSADERSELHTALAQLSAVKASTQQAVAVMAPGTDSSWLRGEPRIELPDYAVGAVAVSSKQRAALLAAQQAAGQGQTRLQAALQAEDKARRQAQDAERAAKNAEAQLPVAEAEAQKENDSLPALVTAADKASKEADRFQMLLNEGVVSANEAKKVAAKYSVAAATRDEASARAQAADRSLAKAKDNLESTHRAVSAAKASLEGAVTARLLMEKEQATTATTVAAAEANLKSVAAARAPRSKELPPLPDNVPVQVQLKPTSTPDSGAKIAAAEALVSTAKTKLEATVLRASARGRIVSLKAIAGQRVRKGQAILVWEPLSPPSAKAVP